MHCVTFLQTVVICSEKVSSSSVSRPSSLTFITLVNKLPLQVIFRLLFIWVESRFPFTVRTLVFFSLSGSLLANVQLKTSDTNVSRDSCSLPTLPQSADDVIVASSALRSISEELT